MAPKKDVIDIVTELGGIKTRKLPTKCSQNGWRRPN